MVKIRVVLEWDAESGQYSATCAELPGCASAGDTVHEAVRNFREAVELYLEPVKEPLPPGAKEVYVTL